MEQIRNAGEIENAQTAAAEEEKGVVNDKPFIGKFASVDALYKAYERLEAEFTRRSQRLKALEAGAQRNTDETTPQGASPDSCYGGRRPEAAGGKQTRRGLFAGRRRAKTGGRFRSRFPARKILQGQSVSRAARATENSRGSGRTRKNIS